MVGLLIFKVHPPTNLLGTAAILFLSAIAGMAIGLAIGALVKNGDAAQPVALVVSMGLTFLGNAMMPLDGAPDTVLTLMKFMPSYYMTHALQRVMMKGQALLTVGFDLAILAATAVIFLSLASWRLRKMFVVNA
jgi:ABC-2 type transport system permease protein